MQFLEFRPHPKPHHGVLLVVWAMVWGRNGLKVALYRGEKRVQQAKTTKTEKFRHVADRT